MASFESLSKSVISGAEEQVKEQVQSMIDSGVEPLEIINKGLIAGMDIVGARFKNGEMFVPEVLMAARCMHEGMAILKPLISDDDMSGKGKVVLGTVKEDLHDIGKNLVGMMIEGGGFQVIDLGVDVASEEFVEAVKEQNPDIIGMSALLTTTVHRMKEVIDLLEENGLRDKVKVIIGGAPISQEFADEIGADGYAPDAATAVDVCKKLIGLDN